MANSLTGDFDCVVQVAGRTINRLMATLHQNAGTSTELPTHPHVIAFRIAESDNADGVCGWLSAQIGVPRIILLDRKTKQFDLEIPLRARFHAETDSAALPEYIHGTVRARYEMTKIDPSCRGWRTHAADHLWLRVIKKSVRFTGTATDDVPIPKDPGVNARIERVIADLLDDRFEAAPHHIGPEFQPGRMISLNSGGQDAVALPIDLAGGDPPVGQVSSIQQVFVGPNDFAVAISADWLMKPILERINGLILQPIAPTSEIPLPIWMQPHVPVQITKLEFEWRGDGLVGSIGFAVQGRAEAGGLAAGFGVDDYVVVYFDAANESLIFQHSAETATISVDVDRPFYVDLAVKPSEQRNIVRAAIRSLIHTSLKNLPVVPLAGYHAKLNDQLTTLDGAASAAFIGADFRPEGIVLQGRIGLTARRPPIVEFSKLADESGFSAFTAWAPGGWIERFVWTAKPYFIGFGEPYSETLRHRWVLARSPGVFTKWGKQMVASPVRQIPGIDGQGQICLEIRGFQVDDVTGARVPFSAKTCAFFGLRLPMARNDISGRLLVTLYEPFTPPRPRPPRPRELGVVELPIPRVDPAAANTLLVYNRGGFGHDSADVLTTALQRCQRDDAGLTVLLLVDTDIAAARGPELAAQAVALSDRIGAHIDIADDVANGWTRRLAIAADDVAWRLITPNGGFTWAHDGRIEPAELAGALDDHLRPSPRPTYAPIGTTVAAGSPIRPWAVTVPVRSPRQRRHCPRIYTTPASYLMTFVRIDSQPSEDQLMELVRSEARAALLPLFAIVDGDKEQALRISERDPHIEVIGDASGSIADKFGVRIWPTTVGVADGMITGVRHGLVESEPPEQVSRDDTASSADTASSRSGCTVT